MLRPSLMLVLLALGGCGDGGWPQAITVGGAGPARGTLTGEEVNDLRTARTRLERQAPPTNRP
ncbi:hypothetical protein ACE7GA_12890 [Roseomonas sp. CCTCC AB2023176]|uniref:hypothetical protein n=1 Tax=Roseomonas sp. CCTCC AB2023176 TaxID=3342640 RepID=UPI0035D789AA